MNGKHTGKNVSTLASNVLKNPNSTAIQKKLAGSALAQSGTSKQTGSSIEAVASKALSSSKYNNTTKTLAGSILSQSDKKR